MNLDLCNSQSGTDKMLHLKGKNTSQATLESTESSESNLGGDTVPTIIVIILIQGLHSAVPAEEMRFGVAAEGTRGTGAFGHCSVLTTQRDRSSLLLQARPVFGHGHRPGMQDV